MGGSEIWKFVGPMGLGADEILNLSLGKVLADEILNLSLGKVLADEILKLGRWKRLGPMRF